MSPFLLTCRHHRVSQESGNQQLRVEMQKSLTMWLFLWVSLLRPTVFGFQLNDTFGQFQSPGFPTAYGDYIYQTWNISVPRGFVIKLYFSHFNLEPSYRCGYDHIKILTEGQQLVKLCGETSTDTEEVPGDKQFFSTGNNMIVIFRTDYSNEKNYTGFAAHYAALEGKLGEEKQDGERSKGPLKAPEVTTGVQEEKTLQSARDNYVSAIHTSYVSTWGRDDMQHKCSIAVCE
ncbi:mannan-binding lectin serine protease 1-like isoform X2 [Scyliorhinus torazame]|uniref:mannan-binding lectin serine protease 1-like isoform X2 n=1 Tax=Scyliorhinus torazame TaxID=75743 RepID=UPI003B59A3BE